MKLTMAQEKELLRLYLARPAVPEAETLGVKATRRGLEKAGALVWCDDHRSYELSRAGVAKGRELAARAEEEGT